MFEEPTTIDMAVDAEGGWLELVITDSGITTDQQRRLELLQQKLQTYARYVLSDAFLRDNPDASRDKVRIRVMSATLPSDAMRRITRVSSPSQSLTIAVVFEQFS